VTSSPSQQTDQFGYETHPELQAIVLAAIKENEIAQSHDNDETEMSVLNSNDRSDRDVNAPSSTKLPKNNLKDKSTRPSSRRTSSDEFEAELDSMILSSEDEQESPSNSETKATSDKLSQPSKSIRAKQFSLPDDSDID